MNSFAAKWKDSQFMGEAETRPEQMTDQDVHDMLGEAVGSSLKALMRNHFFTIGGKIYRQRDGGSIGLDLTTEVASVYMLLWDEECG